MGNMRFLYLLFLKRFKLKIIYRPRRMFWAGIFWTPPSLAVKEICTLSSRNLMKCNTWMNAVKSPFNSCSPTSNTEVIKRKAGFHKASLFIFGFIFITPGSRSKTSCFILFCQKVFYLYSEFCCTSPYIKVFNKYEKG